MSLIFLVCSAIGEELYMFGGVEQEDVYTCAEGLYSFHTGTYIDCLFDSFSTLRCTVKVYQFVLFISHFVLVGSHTWLKRETSGIPPKAQSLSAVVYGVKIFTFGGVLNGEAQNSVHILDTGRTQYRELKTFSPRFW